MGSRLEAGFFEAPFEVEEVFFSSFMSVFFLAILATARTGTALDPQEHLSFGSRSGDGALLPAP